MYVLNGSTGLIHGSSRIQLVHYKFIYFSRLSFIKDFIHYGYGSSRSHREIGFLNKRDRTSRAREMQVDKLSI